MKKQKSPDPLVFNLETAWFKEKKFHGEGHLFKLEPFENKLCIWDFLKFFNLSAAHVCFFCTWISPSKFQRIPIDKWKHKATFWNPPGEIFFFTMVPQGGKGYIPILFVFEVVVPTILISGVAPAKLIQVYIGQIRNSY